MTTKRTEHAICPAQTKGFFECWFRFLTLPVSMDLSFTRGFCSPTPTLSMRKLNSPITHPLKQHLPIITRPKMNPQSTTFLKSSSRTYHLTVTARLKKPIEGVSEKLNLIASQNLDHASARRRVRSAFIEVQQQLDHPLFKVCLFVRS